MPKRHAHIPAPIRGLDTSAPATLIDSRATPNCQDVRVTRTHIKKIEGCMQIGAACDGIIQKIIEFDREQTKYLLRISTRKAEVWNNPAVAWVDKTGASDLVGLHSIPVSACSTKISGKGVLAFTNFVDNIKKYDASGNIADLGGSPPGARFLFPYEGYLVLGYIKSGGIYYPLRVQWPDTDDPEYWTEDDTHNSGHDDLDDTSEPLMGIAGLSNLINPFKSSGIYNGYLTDNDQVFKFEFVERRLGWLANNTVKSIPGGKLLGLGKSGLVEYNGIAAQVVASGIMDDIRWNINPQYSQCAFAEVMEELDEYVLFVPTGNLLYPDLIYRYNYITGQIYKGVSSSYTAAGLRTQLEPTTWNLKVGKWNAQTGKWNEIIQKSLFPVLIFGDSDGKSYKFDYNSKNRATAAIDGFWDSRDFDSAFFFGEEYPGYLFHLTKMFIEGAEGDSVSVYYSTDEGVTYTLLETITLTDTPATYPIDCDILAEKVRIRFRNNTVSETFEFRNFSFERPVLRERIVVS